MRSRLEQCRARYAVLLTNDSSCSNAPTQRDTVDTDFRVHEGREISGVLARAARASSGTVGDRKSPIQIQGSYHLHWQEYSNFPENPRGRFQYLAVSLGR